ncbi:MAG: hypothetical protein HQK76_03995, partial [Desulfobacterales bacterium]|nr:hypothetical protein [Desulfobacterales bacterium]
KTHSIDAYLISLGNNVATYQSFIEKIQEPYKFKQFRRQNRANIKRQEDRKYYIGKIKVAVNRNKRTSQKFDSLKDLIAKQDCNILNLLTVRPAIRPKISQSLFQMGDVVKYNNKIEIVKGFMGNYLGFIWKDKYNHNVKNAKLLIKNQGIVCL